MNFVKHPNLPVNAGGVIISPRTPEKVLSTLQNLKITALTGYDSQQPINGICGHPDTNILHAGNNIFICSPSSYQYYSIMFGGQGMELLKGTSGGEGKYPADIAYNAAVFGKFCIHNFKYSDNLLLNCGFTKINVKQGYCKCSVCVVDKRSIITDDEGIYKACSAQGADALLVSKGDVVLDGVNYGFIGGCSGNLANGILAFTGDISLHRDYRNIKNFCKKKNVEIVSLSNGPLVDIGSIIPVFEKPHTKC